MVRRVKEVKQVMILEIQQFIVDRTSAYRCYRNKETICDVIVPYEPNYKIKTDRVVSIGKDNDDGYEESYGLDTLRFENYKKIVYLTQTDFHEVSVDDAFYLVFVKGEDEPIKIYPCKESVLDDYS